MTDQDKLQKREHKYTWRDVCMALFFLAYMSFGFASLDSPPNLVAYNYASILIGSIGLLSVIFKWKRVEAIMIITWACLLFARSVLLMPVEAVNDNNNIADWAEDIVAHRSLADGSIAFLTLFVLAAYRARRGRVQR